MQTQTHTGQLAIAAMWQAKAGEEAAVADILARLAPQARQEQGVQLFIVQQGVEDRGQFLVYELFDDAAAFAAHQQTPHFRSLVVEQALPRLEKRERVQFSPL